MSWRIEYKGIVNSTIIENTDDARRFIEQVDEQLQVEILVRDFSKIFEQPIFLYFTAQKFFKISKTFLSTWAVDN